MTRLAALDIGSGTIKLSVFERHAEGWRVLCLDEANTELRRGMGTERLLQAGPIAETLRACEAFLAAARGLGVERLPAYATSAVRKAKNPEALIGPLKALGIGVKVLSEEDEGRLNLLGALSRGNLAPPPSRASGESVPSALPRTPLPSLPWRGEGGVPTVSSPNGGEVRFLIIDPGGDSTECTADVDGQGWESAPVASLPFGSVSLQERFGSVADNQPLDWQRLKQASIAAREAALAHPQFGAFVGPGTLPAIRMNLPIQRALETVNGRALTAHGEGGTYRWAELEALTRHTASLDHAGRARLLDGEPIGKVDRTCYGFASWLGILEALKAEAFVVEPWGIKLGAVMALNGVALQDGRRQ